MRPYRRAPPEREASRPCPRPTPRRSRRPARAPHAHLGPFAVDRGLTGRGIGTVLLAEHCRRLDARRLLGYLETDKSENVRFYERGGYRVVGEAVTLGVAMWFMRPEPAHR